VNYDKIIYRIIKLDKSVYLDLISVPASLQRALAIWVASATISLLGILSLFNATVDYIAEELPLFTQMLVQSGASEEDISSFNEAIGFLIDLPPGLSPSVTDIAGQVFFGLVGLAIQVGVIYLILKTLLRRESRWQDILIVIGFSSIPLFFTLLSLFVSSIVFKGIIILFLTLFSLLTLGSGIKQVNGLRNIETVLLVVAFVVVPNILLPFIGF
tara:strand:+ start:3981 stop:4622 length:642 start_codon:yes stop_codon:yes gene_type:complete